MEEKWLEEGKPLDLPLAILNGKFKYETLTKPNNRDNSRRYREKKKLEDGS